MTVTAQLRSALADRYRLERELGVGGMASVYLAEDLKHHRKVAVKVLHAELSAMLGQERFLAEIELTASLQHPHIVPLFDSGSANGLLYYTMPYVRGESLRARLDRERQLPVEEAVRIATVVAGALDYAHRERVIHRDLKPENILLAEGQPLVADFGIALAVSRAGGARVTQTGVLLGTPQYVSPEQATGDRAIDGRADVYALGAVTYEMLTGQPPHSGATPQAIIARVLTEPVRSVRATRPSVPVNIDHAVMRALEKLPADRWATAQAFSDVLEGKTRDAAVLPVLEAIDRQQRPQSRVAVLAPWVLATLLAIGAVALYARERSVPPPRLTWFTITSVGGSAPIMGAALAPDGATLVLAVGSGDSSRLYVRRLADPVPHPLAGGESGFTPFFSADGQWIGFSTPDGHLMRVPVTGGTPQAIAELSRPVGVSWGAANMIVTGMSEDGDSYSGLWRLRADGGTPQRLTHPAPSTMHHYPMLLADGKTVVFQVYARDGTRLGVASIDSGQFAAVRVPMTRPLGEINGHLIYQDGSNIWSVPFDAAHSRVTGTPVAVQQLLGSVRGAWLASDGTLVYLASSPDEPMLVDVAGHQEALPSFGAELDFPRISPDGRKIAFVAATAGRRGGVYIYDIESRTYTRLTSTPIPRTLDERGAPPTWSPDGSRVVYSPTPRELWWQRADGSGVPERLLTLPADAQVGPSSISPDGRWLALDVVHEDSLVHLDIYVVPLAHPSALTPFVATPADEFWPRWSPDGKWIAYQSNETGRDEVYIRRFPDGERVQISDQGGMIPAWTAGGQLLYRTARRIMMATLGTSNGATVVRSRTIAYAGLLPPASALATFDVAPNGQRLVVFALNAAERPAVMVGLNWQQAVLQPQLR